MKHKNNPILFFFLLCIIALVTTSCTKTEYVSVPEYHYINTYTVDSVRDSIYHDVFRNVYIKGDTVFDTKKELVYRDRFKYIYKDSIVRDSIPVLYPVERKLTKWERLCIDWFGYVVGLALAVLALLIIIVLYLIKKKVWKIGAMLP